MWLKVHNRGRANAVPFSLKNSASRQRNQHETRDLGVRPEKSFLFFLTARFRGIGLTGDTDLTAGKAPRFLRWFGARTTGLENRVELFDVGWSL